MASLLLQGTFVHTVDGVLQILPSHYALITNGVITSITPNRPDTTLPLVTTSPTQLIIPGLIDSHIHAPQYVFSGCGLDLPLLQWLETYTFPAETKFSDPTHASNVYSQVVTNTLSFGTTTACYFATIDVPSSLLLSQICLTKGQRAFVGKVSMDRNSPPTYTETTPTAIAALNSFLTQFNQSQTLVRPILTPRFVPTCTETLMTSMSELQSQNPSILVQSHVSENLGEIDWVHSLHPDCENYVSVYDKFGLLNQNTLLAHGVHLTDSELSLLHQKNSSIAHCPSSNFQLFSGTCDVRRLQKAGVNVSLGTDVAGGPSCSIIDAMRQALVCSRSILFQKREKGETYEPLTVPDVLALATEGGAKALGLSDKVGNFVEGKEFDALVVDVNTGMIDCFGEESVRDMLDKFVYLGDDRNVVKVFVQGKLVKEI